MSRFYTEIAKYYDYIFPTGKAQLNLIKQIAGNPPKDILDVASGSGGYSKELNDSGYNVTAIDLDESMINSLKTKQANVNAKVLNMLDIDKLGDKFDFIFCIGNSLVHLESNAEIYSFLEKCKNILNPKGHLLIQIVNYDRILAKDVKSLPLITNEEMGLIFERYYDYIPDKHKLDFKTILKVNEMILENHVLLHPVKSNELVDLLRKVGFSNANLYGSFNKDEFEPMNSFPLIAIAEI